MSVVCGKEILEGSLDLVAQKYIYHITRIYHKYLNEPCNDVCMQVCTDQFV